MRFAVLLVALGAARAGAAPGPAPAPTVEVIATLANFEVCDGRARHLLEVKVTPAGDAPQEIMLYRRNRPGGSPVRLIAVAGPVFHSADVASLDRAPVCFHARASYDGDSFSDRSDTACLDAPEVSDEELYAPCPESTAYCGMQGTCGVVAAPEEEAGCAVGPSGRTDASGWTAWPSRR